MKVAILGGGISGLTAAYNLSKNEVDVDIIEKRDKLGGLTASLSVKSYNIEEFYHHVFKDDKELMKLIRELNIYSRMSWDKARSGSIDLNGIYELTTPLDLLFYKPLNLIEKMKLGIFVVKMKLIKNYENYDGVNAKEWIIKNVGISVYKNFFEPLLKSKYGKFSDEISAAWFISRIALRSNRNINGETLGYMNGGFEKLIEELSEKFFKKSNNLNKNFKICLACSAGGHLTELMQLKRCYSKYSHFFVTFKREDTMELNKTEKVYFITDTKRSLFNFIKNVFESILILIKEKPDIIISTGAGVAIPTCYIGKMIFGAKLIYLESFCRTEKPSLAGKIAYPISDLFFVQWKEMLSKYGDKAIHRGAVV